MASRPDDGVAESLEGQGGVGEDLGHPGEVAGVDPLGVGVDQLGDRLGRRLLHGRDCGTDHWPRSRPMAPASRLGRPRRVSLRSASFIVHSPALTPSQRSGSGSQRGETWPDPGEPGQRRVGPGDQVGQGAPGQVGRRHAVADVPAGPGQAGGAVEAHRGVPVPRNAERPAPGVGEAGVGHLGEQLGQGLAQQGVARPARCRRRGARSTRSGTAPPAPRRRCGRPPCAARK